EDGGQETSKAVQQVNSTTVSSRRLAILADGTYATQSAAVSPPTLVQCLFSSNGNLRSLILSGDFFLGEVVACTLT
ncbi:coatomer subunit beta-1-like, partial [Trifolium medium]|nr:coatomer subunit beta-1-like [Trifolium medium]